MISWILFVLAALSVLLNVWQWCAARRFQLGSREPNRFAPALSILRPLKDCDSETARCLESWFLQNYPGEYELLFGVASEKDPICEIVRKLMKKYPAREASLVICDPILGANAKVSTLCYLAKRARNEHVVISDQDVLVSAGFLSALIQPLADKTVGLVNCFYILANPRGLPMWLEAVAVNADFWSHVLQGNMLRRMEFALGAAMATKQTHLAEIGGFEGLLDHLADDYQLGNRIAKSGARLEICPVPVECWSAPQSANAVWQHQLRWARTIRVCQPVPYFLSILGNGTLWPVLGLIANGSRGAYVMSIALALRIISVASLYRRLTKEAGWRAGLLAPLKDLVQVAIWAMAFGGNQIKWRNRRFRVDKGGKLTPLA